MARLVKALSLTAVPLLLSIALAPPAAAPPGDLDTAFDSDGKVTTDFGANEGAAAVAIQPDGRIVVAGASAGDFALARYNRDGSLDTTFDADGKVTTDSGGPEGTEAAEAVAIQPDGRIVVAGASAGDFALARYNRDGSLDTSFGSDGKVTTDFGGTDRAKATAVQPNGKIVAAGNIDLIDFALARYNRDGSLDTTFDADGKVTTDFGQAEEGTGAAIQPDGRIVVAGALFGPRDFLLARYNRDGSLDTTFDSDGKVTTDFGGLDTAIDLAIQTDGKIVAVGDSFLVGLDFALARYNRDGSLDTTFDADGKVTTDFGGSEVAVAVAVRPDGRIVAAGPIGDVGDFALASYVRDGSLDTSFDSDGKVTTDFGAFEFASDLAIQPDGRIVAAGTTGAFPSTDFALARYLGR
jgi:uncharacterized delta-60 repeat protein